MKKRIYLLLFMILIALFLLFIGYLINKNVIQNPYLITRIGGIPNCSYENENWNLDKNKFQYYFEITKYLENFIVNKTNNTQINNIEKIAVIKDPDSKILTIEGDYRDESFLIIRIKSEIYVIWINEICLLQ